MVPNWAGSLCCSKGATAGELAAERRLAQSGVSHANLVNYHTAFEAAPVGSVTRSYAVAEPILAGVRAPGLLAAQRLCEQLPAAADTAVGWIEAIRPAAEALLAANLWLPKIEPAQLLLVEGVVRLDAASTVQPYEAAQRSAIRSQQQLALGKLLQQLAPGAQLSGTPVKTLPLPTPAGPVSLSVRTGALTDLGNVREINEDSIVTLEVDLVHNSASQPLRLYAVADGMGGHAAGEVASMCATNELTNALMKKRSAAIAGGTSAGSVDLRLLLKEAGLSAAKAVYEQAQRMRTDMGTTLVAALVDAKSAKAYVINVGDSRLYKICSQSIRQVTKDHSMVQLLIDKQQLTPDEARHHPNANLIYRTLGDKPQVEIDLFEESLVPGDALLLCSDGLSGLVEDRELQAAVEEEPTPEGACRRLVALAKQRGGHDNITVIVVRFSAAPSNGMANAGGL